MGYSCLNLLFGHVSANLSSSLYIPPPNTNGYGKLVKKKFKKAYKRNVKPHTQIHEGNELIKSIDWKSKSAIFERTVNIKKSTEFQNCWVSKS